MPSALPVCALPRKSFFSVDPKLGSKERQRIRERRPVGEELTNDTVSQDNYAMQKQRADSGSP